MKFSKFSEYLQKLEETTKRLEITSILADLFKNLEPAEIKSAVYLSLGQLAASFENPKFAIADKMMIRILESSLNLDKKKIEDVYGRTGDLGDTLLELWDNSKTKDSLTINEVHEKLLEIAEVSGESSQDLKVQKTANLLKKLDPLSAKYLVRIILNTTRLGFTELTIIAAVAQAAAISKSDVEKIEETYNTHPDIGLIVESILQNGLKGLDKISIDTGVPVNSQKCQRLSGPEEILDKMKTVRAEYKFDGTRVQLHLDRNKKTKPHKVDQTELFGQSKPKVFAKTFTRNLEDTTHQYPDLIEAALEQIDADSVILDGEAIGFNRETGEFLPFQEIMQRKRKHDIAEFVKNIPLRYFVFDILFLNGKSLVSKPLSERRELLEKVIKKGSVLEPSFYLETSDIDELSEFFEDAKHKNLEGMIVKKPDGTYQAGARSFNWVKYKKADEKLLEDTIDCVVLGYSYGKGVRAEFGIGKFLVGVWDEESEHFKTITKVGTGLKDEEFKYLKEQADKVKVNEKPANVDCHKNYTQDVWLKPYIVVEIGGDELTKSNTHTAGFALRFPRLIKFRTDKTPTQITTTKEVSDLHKQQKRGYYNENSSKS